MYDNNTLTSLPTTSSKIRYLDKCGVKRGDIARILTKLLGKTIRYQHVRNVLIQDNKKPVMEVMTAKDLGL